MSQNTTYELKIPVQISPIILTGQFSPNVPFGIQINIMGVNPLKRVVNIKRFFRL